MRLATRRRARGWRALAAHYGYADVGSIDWWHREWEQEGFKPYRYSGRVKIFNLDQVDEWLEARPKIGGTRKQKDEIDELQAEIEGLEADKLHLKNAIAAGQMLANVSAMRGQTKIFSSFKSDVALWIRNVLSESDAMEQTSGDIDTLRTNFFRALMKIKVPEGVVKDCLVRSFDVRTRQGKLEWIEKNHYLSARATTTDGQRFVPYPFQRGIIHMLGDYRVERFYLKKPAKIGWTQILKGALAHDLVEMGRAVGIWFPRDADKNRFASVQIASMLQDIPAVARAMVGDSTKRSSDNSVDRVSFESAMLYINAALSPINFRDFDVDTALLDEVSGMPKNVGEEGTIEDNAIGRTAASNAPALRAGSTPKTTDNCNISRLVSSCREVLERYVKCPDCGHEFVFDFGDQTTKYGMKFLVKYYDDDREQGVDIDATVKSTRYACGECATLHSYSRLRKMDEAGQWRSKNYRLDEKAWQFTDHDGNVVNPPSEMAMQMSGMLSYDLPWSKGVDRFLRAVQKKRNESDPMALIQFFNEYLGQTWEIVTNANIIKDDVLASRAEVYESDCPNGVQAITAYIDLHPTFVVAEVKGWGYGLENWSLKYVHEMGSPTASNVVADVVKMIDADYTKPDGSVLRCSVIGFDTGWQPDIGYRWHKSNRLKFIACKGSSTYGRPIMTPPNKNPNKDNVNLMMIGTDTGKDTVYEQLSIDMPGPGYAHFPEHDEESELYKHYNKEYYRGILSEKKKLVYRNGEQVTIYVKKTATQRNEPLDCHVGNSALVRLLISKYRLELIPLEKAASNDLEVNTALPSIVYKSAADIFDEIQKNS